MGKLTKAQRCILERLAEGEHISYSQDGEVGWLWPSRIQLEEVGISDCELQDLRDRKLMAMRQDEDDECVRFSPPDVITTAGRAALEDSK